MTELFFDIEHKFQYPPISGPNPLYKQNKRKLSVPASFRETIPSINEESRINTSTDSFGNPEVAMDDRG